MKITIEEMCCSYSCDWSKEDKVEDGVIEPYFPSVSETIETFFWLLGSVYPREKIADCVAEGIDALDYSEKGVNAKKLLRSIQ